MTPNVPTIADDPTDDLARLRSLLGTSAALWAGVTGVRIERGRWSAISGARAVNFNVVMCHDASGGTLLTRSLDELAAARTPALIIVGGEALGEVQGLVEAGWVCVGSAPFMACELDRYGGDASGSAYPAARRLDGPEVDEARALVGDGFRIPPELALVALPADAATRPGQSVWGAFEGGELVSSLAAVRVQDHVAIWSMVTAATARRRGYGARVLSAALTDAARSGARLSLVQASPAAEPFYTEFGYRLLERWQLWSRRRWMLPP